MPKEIEIRSEEVQELLGKPPHWLTRWGMLFALILLSGLFWSLYLLKYPETITTEIQIQRENPGQELIATANNRISEILVNPEDTIVAGQTLFVFDNSAEYGDVQTLANYLSNIVKSPGDSLMISFRMPTNLLLGSDNLKDRFDAFVDQQREVDNILTGRSNRQGISDIQDEIRFQNRLIRSELSRIPLLEDELTLANDGLTYQKNIESSGRGKPNEKRQAQAQKLEAERNLQDAKSRIRNSRLRIKQLQEQAEETTTFTARDKTNAVNELRNSFTALLSALDEWEKRYLIISEIAGIIILNEQAKVKNQVSVNDRLGIIMPTNNDNLIGITKLELSKSGQVESGQKVLVDFASFPAQKYGVVEGNVAKKSLIPDQNNLLRIEVRFKDGLITNKGKALAVGQFMEGNMVIVIEERRLIEWLIDRF